MIQPINQNSITKTNLEPVDVPHFTGARKSGSDSFNRSTKVEQTTFGQKARQKVRDARKSVEKGVDDAKDVADKGSRFTKTFLKSLYDDTIGIVREKIGRKIAKI